MSDTWYCKGRSGDFVETDAYDGTVLVTCCETHMACSVELRPDDAIALGKRLIELGEEVKRGD